MESKPILALLLAFAATATLAQAATTYTWTGGAGDGDWTTAGNWDANGMPVDADTGNGGLSFNANDSKIVFSTTSMPTSNVPQMGGYNNANGYTPVLDLQSGGSLTIQAGAGSLKGIVTQAGGSRDIYIVGDGVGTVGTNDAVTLNVSLKGYLNRHRGGITHNFIVNSDGILNFLDDGWADNQLNFYRQPNNRYATLEIAGGAVNAALPIKNLTLDDKSYVEFTALGGTFTAKFGNDFADIAAVRSGIGTTSFIAGTGLSLAATDNGDNTFTVTAVPEPSSIAFLLVGLGMMARRRRK